MTLLIGCDFSSSPNRHKPIVIARGQLHANVVTLHALEPLASLDAFAHWLVREPDWIGGFDFPFGLPRALVQELGWPGDWLANIAHYAGMTRAQIRDVFAAYCARRPTGHKFAHRATDRRAGSSSSMKWVNPPVAYMLHAGVPRLIKAGVCVPGLHAGDRTDRDAGGVARRVALEAYPGLLACWRAKCSVAPVTRAMTAPGRHRSGVITGACCWTRFAPGARAWHCVCR